MKLNDKFNRQTAIFSVILAGILWGIISIFVRRLSAAGLDSMQIMLIRAWGGAIVMLIFILIVKPSYLKIKLRDLWMFFGSGVISLTGFSWCYFTTIINCGAGIGVVLLYTSPIFVMLLSALLFKERITSVKITALVATFAGCVFVSGLIGSENALTPLSFLIGIGAGLGYAMYSVFSRYALAKYHIFTIIFYTFVFSGVALLFIAEPIQTVRKINSDLWLTAAALALFSTVLPYIFYTYGMSKMDNSRAATLVTVEPLVGSALGIFAYGEDVGILKITGMALILVSIVLLALPDKHKQSD